MSTSGGPQDISLLQLVENDNYQQRDNRSIYNDVLQWFEQHSSGEKTELALTKTNESGETALHVILKQLGENEMVEASMIGNARLKMDKKISTFSGVADQQECGDNLLLGVVQKYIAIAGDATRIQDSQGFLPLHHACRERACGFGVIQSLIEEYPAGLGVMCKIENNYTNMRHTPFGWDCATCTGGHFTDFLRYVVANDFSSSGNKTITMMTRKAQHTLLNHCKNWAPLAILKKGMLNEKTLESKAMVRWLNEIPCKGSVVCSMVFELYLHIAWIVTFGYTTTLHLEEDKNIQGWEPIALLVLSSLFFFQEFYQLYRFVMTNSGLAYVLDLWNWIDLATCFLVATSAIKFLQKEEGTPNNDLLIFTGFFQFVLLTSYLKKTFFPFSKFVRGVMMIISSLVPFLVISAIVLLAFSYMYYVKMRHSPSYSEPYNEIPHDDINPFGTLVQSFKTVFAPFAGGPLETEDELDFFYGIVIMIVLLNVVIAVVSEAWEAATEEANEAFWEYRLGLILEKTRGAEKFGFVQTPFYKCFRQLDDNFINIETVGTTTGELKQKLSLAYREEGLFSCVLLVVKSVGFIILGIPTCGLFWPKYFRQILFTPPQPKEDETKKQIEHLVAEVETCQSDIAKYRLEVSQLSVKMDAQTELMQRILSKIE